LTPEQLLRRDYKEFEIGGTQLGMAAVPAPLRSVCPPPEALLAYMRARGLRLLVLQSAYSGEGGALQRELLLLGPSALIAALEEHLSHTDLQLRRETGLPGAAQGAERLWLEGLEARWYAQGNSAASRKQLQPMLAAFLAALPTHQRL
jgi:hypothetical protein